MRNCASSDVWVLAAAAPEVGVAERARLAEAAETWLESAPHSAIVLTTCHRVELYGFADPPLFSGMSLRIGADAVEHLLRVATGLESAIVGEDDVLHQVRCALRNRRRKQLDGRLLRLFELAVGTGRRARSGRTAPSGDLASNAVDWLRDRIDVGGGETLVVGAGRMGSVLAHRLTAAGATVTIASRNVVRASRLAALHHGNAVDLGEAARHAHEFIAVAVALGGPWRELAPEHVDGRSPIADISAPQSIPDAVRRRLNGSFLGIDDLRRPAGAIPGPYIANATALIEARTIEYVQWLDRSA
jgi:glutamyl-tRNA reductase